MQARRLRNRALVALLHNIRNRYALARDPLVARAAGPALAFGENGRAELIDRLPGIVESLVNELSSESGEQNRRFAILLRSDIERERHESIARDVGVSRSQFYRDLSEARACLMQALEERLSAYMRVEDVGCVGRDDVRFAAIDALRDGGSFSRARTLARTVARESGGGAKKIQALCILAELEIASGSFDKAMETTTQAKLLVADIGDDQLEDLLGAACDLMEFEVAHCSGEPAGAIERAFVIDRLRRGWQTHDRRFADLLVKALVQEADILFEQDQAERASAVIGEASSVAARSRLGGTRLAVDVAIRASGIRAVHADRVSSALDETAEIVQMGNRKRDARTLRLGLQMMAAHLLTLGRLEEARRFALEALALIDLFGSALDRLVILSNLARIDINRGDGAQALRWINMADDLSCNAFSITQALAISKAEALILIGEPKSAAMMVESLGEVVRKWPRLRGRAKLAEAMALVAMDREREARSSSEEAVELSRGTAGPQLHLRALDLNVKLTGNAESTAELRDLREALTVC